MKRVEGCLVCVHCVFACGFQSVLRRFAGVSNLIRAIPGPVLYALVPCRRVMAFLPVNRIRFHQVRMQRPFNVAEKVHFEFGNSGCDTV